MRPLLFCIAALFLPLSKAYSQEFSRHDNGLIYSDTTMRQLHRIVDSLHLRFKSCDPNPVYYAKPQTLAHWVRLDSAVEAAAAFLETQPSHAAFLQKFPFARTDSSILVVSEVTDDGKIRLSGWPEESRRLHVPFRMNLPDSSKSVVFTTYPEYTRKKRKKGGSLAACFFIAPVEKRQLPARYGRLVQYVDCLVDTATTTYLSNNNEYDVSDDSLPARKAFNTLIDPSEKQVPGKGFDWKKHSEWLRKREENIEQHWSKTGEFHRLLSVAVEEAIERKAPSSELEKFAGRYLSSQKELHLKRLRRVTGSCSMDESPRLHALDIAQLAAETASWEVFLRSHLDIMNDRFLRASDGSYAWGERRTYIRELELLDIDVPGLLIGTCLRLDKAAEHHYFASISRVGRALSESGQYDEVEKRLAAAIADPELDDFNRLLLWYLYDNMTHWKAPEAKDEEDRKRIHADIDRRQEPVKATLPRYIAARVKE